MVSLQKQLFLLAPRRSWMFREEEHLRLSDRNSILMTKVNVYIKIRQSWGSKCKFCSILGKLLLVDFGKVLSSPVKKLQQNLNASFVEIIFHKYWLFCYGFIVFTFDLCSLLSVIRKQQLKQCNQSVVQSALDSGQTLRHQYGISVTELQMFLLAKCPWRRGARRNGCFRRLATGMVVKLNLSQVLQLCSW